MIVLYNLEVSPPSRCVRMVLEALGLEYELYNVDYTGGELASDDYFKINCRRRVPALKDGEYIIAESRAISCYLCNKYEDCGSIYPEDPSVRGRVDQLLYISEDVYETVQKYLNTKAVLFGKGVTNDGFKQEVLKSIELCEGFLREHEFIATNQFTIADIHVSSPLFMLEMANFDGIHQFPKTYAWLEKIRQLPYFGKCNDKGSAILTKLYQDAINRNTT